MLTINIIIWVGFSQSLFAAILVSAKKNLEVQDKILSAWLFLLAIEFLTGGIDILIWGLPLLSSSFLLFNPAFYLYVKSLTKPGFKLNYLQLLHLLPFLGFELGAYLLEEKYSLRNFFEIDSTVWFRFSFSIASVISWIVYNFFSIRMVYFHRRHLESEFSNIEGEKQLKWIIFIVIFYNLFDLFSFIIAGLDTGLTDFRLKQYAYNYSALLVLIYVLGFYGLRQSSIFVNNLNTNSENEELYKEKYPKSYLSDERKSLIKNAILTYMKNEKPYLNSDFNMSLLSSALSVPRHQLTEVLSTELGKNFYTLVNEYRVEEVIKQLSIHGSEFSIEGIGYDAGFSNKSTFFTVFKRFTGLSPMKYRVKHIT